MACSVFKSLSFTFLSQNIHRKCIPSTYRISHRQMRVANGTLKCNANEDKIKSATQPTVNATQEKSVKVTSVGNKIKQPGLNAYQSEMMQLYGPVLKKGTKTNQRESIESKTRKKKQSNESQNERGNTTLPDIASPEYPPIFNESRHLSKVTESCLQIPKRRIKNTSSCSVSTILHETMSENSKLILQKWEQNMIKQLGLKGFRNYKQETFRSGHMFHSSVEEVLRGKDISNVIIDPSNEGHWESVLPFLESVHSVAAIESFVQHPHLNYHGILDCVAVHNETLMLFEWKTSQKPKPKIRDTYDNPVQIAAYIGAINHDENYKFKVENAALVLAYEDGNMADFHPISTEDCQKYWKIWLQRLELFKNMHPEIN